MIESPTKKLLCSKCNKLLPIVKFRKLVRHGDKNLRTECYNCEKQYFKIRAKKLKIAVFSYYSGDKIECNCCGEKEVVFLTLDHVNNDGAEKRRNGEPLGQNLYNWLVKNDFPEGFQVLCFNCNCGRRINKNICPHKNK